MATLEHRGGKYCIRYSYKDEDGIRRHKRETFDKYKQAAAFKTKIENDMLENEFVEPSKQTVREYLTEWLEDYKDEIAYNTYTGYRTNTRHINKHVGNYPLQKLQAHHIEKMYKQLRSTLSGTSIRYIHRTLSRALTLAEKDQLLKKNPCGTVDIPKRTTYTAAFLDEQEVAQLMEAAKDTDIYIAVVLAVSRGMRRNEILGLRWQDINFAKNNISINHSIRYEKGDYIRETPKSEKSIRILPLSDKLKRLLKEQRARQKKNMELFWNDYHKSDYICTYADGKLINPPTFSVIFSRLLKKNNLRHVRFHDLRHTSASLMLREGIELKVVSDILGHSTITITSDLYTHVLDDLKKDVAKKMDSYLR